MSTKLICAEAHSITPLASFKSIASLPPGRHELIAHVGLLPGLIESESRGPFIDLLQAIIEVSPQVHISIRAFPMQRAVNGIISGVADLNLPALRNAEVKPESLPYRFSATAFGKVAHVLYSNTSKPLTREMVLRSGKPGGPRLVIVGITNFWPFPVQQEQNVDLALKMLARGRIDGFLWAQEETDLTLKKLALTNIHREHFGDYDDVFIIAKGPRGDVVDAMLTRAINKLRSSGRLAAMYSKIHGPYHDWQPG
ncbi:hypothetical protein HZU77_008365 [Neisseriaceae bacterium TC5R-5]|nr:hypothetical protein [Neisseriaceae bacterium TC5R-5]